MKKNIFISVCLVIMAAVVISQINCSPKEENKAMSQKELIARGKYLVMTGGCGDCHSPKIYTENGPIPDSTKDLSGFQHDEKLPALDTKYVAPGNWVATESNFSAWVGPWGISYAANITPDKATGIGELSEEMFIKALREGKMMGVGRPILPPMPWQVIGQKSDQDLKAMYAYLKSINPIHNEVPQPIPPDKMKDALSGK